MNNIVAQKKASTTRARDAIGYPSELYGPLEIVIPLKHKSKAPLIGWFDENWKPSLVEIKAWTSEPVVNCGFGAVYHDFGFAVESAPVYPGSVPSVEISPDITLTEIGENLLPLLSYSANSSVPANTCTNVIRVGDSRIPERQNH